MRFWDYSIKNYLVDYLGDLFGKSKMQRFFYALVYPLELQYMEYDEWRRKELYLTNINAQVIKLRNYLNDIFDNDLRRISIVSSSQTADGVFVALESEGNPDLEAGIESAGEAGVFIGTEAEVVVSRQFILYVPQALDPIEPQIVAKVNEIKLAGKQFTIQYF